MLLQSNQSNHLRKKMQLGSEESELTVRVGLLMKYGQVCNKLALQTCPWISVDYAVTLDCSVTNLWMAFTRTSVSSRVL
jgi:hypothetical protein